MKHISLGLAVAAALGVGCSDECSSAFDCEATEVCSNGICAPGQASYLVCTSNDECNDGDPNGPFECVGGACRIIGSGIAPADAGGGGGTDGGGDGGGAGIDGGMSMDSGAAGNDAGSPDGGGNPADSGMGGGNDAGADSGIADTGMSGGADAGGNTMRSMVATVDNTTHTFINPRANENFNMPGEMRVAGIFGGGALEIRFPQMSGRFDCASSPGAFMVISDTGLRLEAGGNINDVCEVNVTTYNAGSGGRVVGTFSGVVDGFQGTTMLTSTIMNGSFDLPIL